MYVQKKYIYSFSEKLFNIIQYSWWLQTEINGQPLYSFSFYAIMVMDTLNTIYPLLIFFSVLGSIKGFGPLSPSDLKKYIHICTSIFKVAKWSLHLQRCNLHSLNNVDTVGPGWNFCDDVKIQVQDILKFQYAFFLFTCKLHLRCNPCNIT